MMKRIIDSLNDIWTVLTAETRRVLSDMSVLLIFFGGSLLYPFIFCIVYNNEQVDLVPVAVVDESDSESSKRLARMINSTPELTVDYRCASLGEAKQLLREQRIHGIFYIPRDYDTKLARMETAHVAVFCDMTPFLYYRSIMQGASNVMKSEMERIEKDRYGMAGQGKNEAETSFRPIAFDDVKLYNPSGGFTSFLVPALLILVLHQTLFLGISILSGTANEEKKALRLIPPRLRNRSVHRVTIGRTLCYLLIYIPLSAIVLVLVPHMAMLPQIGNIGTLTLFVLPFLLATTLFSMTFCNVFINERVGGILFCIFFSVVLLFLSGVVWPYSNLPEFWKAFSYIFPSTPAMRGYVKIASMGATLSEVRLEYFALWAQTGIYFITACGSLRFIKRFKKA